jgi:hypothetical protein
MHQKQCKYAAYLLFYKCKAETQHICIRQSQFRPKVKDFLEFTFRVTEEGQHIPSQPDHLHAHIAIPEYVTGNLKISNKLPSDV